MVSEAKWFVVRKPSQCRRDNCHISQSDCAAELPRGSSGGSGLEQESVQLPYGFYTHHLDYMFNNSLCPACRKKANYLKMSTDLVCAIFVNESVHV